MTPLPTSFPSVYTSQTQVMCAHEERNEVAHTEPRVDDCASDETSDVYSRPSDCASVVSSLP